MHYPLQSSSVPLRFLSFLFLLCLAEGHVRGRTHVALFVDLLPGLLMPIFFDMF